MDFGKQLIEEINFARTKPAEYAQKILSYEKYFKDKTLSAPGEKDVLTKEGFGAFFEAAHHLSQMFPVLPLKHHAELTKVAQEALVDIQKITDVHGASQLNMDYYVEKWGFVVGSFNEAIELGSLSAEHVVIHLLVDDGNLDRGNRKHLMSPNYRLVGWATGEHKVFGHSTVLAYARSFYGHSEEPVLEEDHKKEIEEKKQPTDIAKKPKHTFTMTDDHEVITDKGKTIHHTEIEKKEDKKDGYLSYSYYKSTSTTHTSDHDQLPEDVVKIDKDEKIKLEHGKKYKYTTVKKTMKDGSVKTETSKVEIN
jgi:hypothetical protein